MTSGIFSPSCSNSKDPVASRTCSSELFPVHGKTKRVMAAVGYSIQNPEYLLKLNTEANKEEAEQFCYSMLGGECKLGLDVVRDVLYQCNYDVEKAMDVLLDISASSGISIGDGEEDRIPKFTCPGTISDSIFGLSDKEVETVLHSCRSYSEVLTSSERQGVREESLPEQVLNSLFRTRKTSAQQHDDDMNWENVVKKIAPFGQGSEFHPYRVSDIRRSPEQAKRDDYKVFRKGATRGGSSKGLIRAQARDDFYKKNS